jgi:hypothetical protein
VAGGERRCVPAARVGHPRGGERGARDAARCLEASPRGRAGYARRQSRGREIPLFISVFAPRHDALEAGDLRRLQPRASCGKRSAYAPFSLHIALLPAPGRTGGVAKCGVGPARAAVPSEGSGRRDSTAPGARRYPVRLASPPRSLDLGRRHGAVAIPIPGREAHHVHGPGPHPMRAAGLAFDRRGRGASRVRPTDASTDGRGGAASGRSPRPPRGPSLRPARPRRPQASRQTPPLEGRHPALDGRAGRAGPVMPTLLHMQPPAPAALRPAHAQSTVRLSPWRRRNPPSGVVGRPVLCRGPPPDPPPTSPMRLGDAAGGACWNTPRPNHNPA